MDNVRELGRFLTVNNPFSQYTEIIKDFLFTIKFNEIIEPFAGEGHLIEHIKNIINISDYYISMYDIVPIKEKNILQNNSILNFPSKQNGLRRLCITNPPYLSKASAKRNKLNIDSIYWGNYDDLWKVSLEVILKNCEYAIIILPIAVINNRDFRPYLQYYIPMFNNLFQNTEYPVALCLFNFTQYNETKVILNNIDYSYNQLLNNHNSYFINKIQTRILFNNNLEQFWIKCIDNIYSDDIKAMAANECKRISTLSDRFYSKIFIPDLKNKHLAEFLSLLNYEIINYRLDTQDLFLTVFKGLQKENIKFRRRMSYTICKQLINNVLIKLGY